MNNLYNGSVIVVIHVPLILHFKSGHILDPAASCCILEPNFSFLYKYARTRHVRSPNCVCVCVFVCLYVSHTLFPHFNLWTNEWLPWIHEAWYLPMENITLFEFTWSVL